MRTDTLKHGTNQIGATYYGERVWKRRDIYTPNDGREPVTESRFAAGSGDTSPMFIDGDNGRYDSRCSCCFLGFSHTLDAHSKEAGAHLTITEPCSLYLSATGCRSFFFSVMSLAEASAAWVRYRDMNGLGASDMGHNCGNIYGADRVTLVARISYNGRAWSPSGELLEESQ